MNLFKRFQERNKKYSIAQDKMCGQFIYKGYPSIAITNGDNTVQAAVVNKQEKDCAYIYTPANNPLDIGSIWTAKELHMLVTEKITIIKDVTWNKYYALLCNIELEGTWGYFKGPEKNFINVHLAEQVAQQSQQHPVLVLAENALHFKDKIKIKDRAWMVQEYDAISTPGLVYYSLIPSTMSKESDTIEHYEEPQIASDILTENTITAGQTHTVTTEDGYFVCKNKSITVLKHTATEVTFKVNYGCGDIALARKENGAVVNEFYEVK